MKPDRFEILVCLSGVAVAALITTAAFGMAAGGPPVDAGRNNSDASPAIFASTPWAGPHDGFAGSGLIQRAREIFSFVRPAPALR
jgi:hypothetical protein